MIPLDDGIVYNVPEPTISRVHGRSWCEELEDAIELLMKHPKVAASISKVHTEDTPRRVVKAFGEYFSGLMEDPKEVLERSFESGKCDQMVTLFNIPFISYCSHHLLPFAGHVHFGYLPDNTIVGLSKIPRLIEIYSRRPQVQEKLTNEIVDTFFEIVKPRGCGVVVDAEHMCMVVRGVKKEGVITRTTAIRGVFNTEPSVKQEFLSGIPTVESR